MFRVEYLFGMSPRFGSVLVGGNQHDNVGYYLNRDKKDFNNLEDAQKFFDKLENTWETEPIYEKDRFEKKGVPHYLEIVLKNFDGNKWNILKKSTYDDWFKANKERKFQEYDAQHASNNDEEPAGIEDNVMENKKNMKNQIKLNESQFRKIVENKVREVLKESFGGLDQMFDTESELDDEPIQQPTGYIIVNDEGKGWTNNGMYGQPAWTYQLDATEFGGVTVYKSPAAAKRIADKIGGTVREY